MNHRLFASANSLLLVALLALASGCDSGASDRWTQDRPPVYPTSGQVLLDGQPIEGATVTFQPLDGAGKPGYATTDGDGRFEAQTFDPGDGLTAGRHRVAIQKTAMVDRSGNVVEVITDEGTGLTEKNFLPAKYADYTASGLEVEIVPDTENALEPFALSEQ